MLGRDHYHQYKGAVKGLKIDFSKKLFYSPESG